jgi:pentatricopeptide repeat protein
MAAPVPRLIEHFVLEGEAGRGGFGVVHRARHRATGELAAAKVSHVSSTDEDLARVAREAELVSRLEHPHLARLYGLFTTDDGHPALVYEWVSGGTLAEHPGPPERAPERGVMHWLEEAAAGLDLLHRHGLVHRDVKPANLMLDDEGRVRLVDYGLIRPEGHGRTVTATGVLLGTPAFMPPEALRGERVGPAADRFALAVTAYWLMTGRHPFGDADPGEIVRAQRSPPPPPSEVGSRAAVTLGEVFARALSPEPADRPPSCGTFVEELRLAWRGCAPEGPREARTVRVSSGPVGPSPSSSRRLPSTRRRARGPLRHLGVVAALGLAVGAVLVRSPATPPTREPTLPAVPSVEPDIARLIRTRTALTDLDAVFTDPQGRTLTERERQGTQGARRVLDRDPVFHNDLLDRLPDLSAVLAGLAAGPLWSERSEEFRLEARATDEAFLAQDLPAPFAPHRNLAPWPDPVVPGVVLEGALRIPLPRVLRRPVRGWAATMAQELALAARGVMAKDPPFRGEGALPSYMPATTLLVQLQPDGGAKEAAQRGFDAPEIRTEMADHFRPEVLALHRALLAAGRSLREAGPDASWTAAVWAYVSRNLLELLFRSHLVRLPLALLTGPVDEEAPDAAFFLSHLPSLHGSGRGALPAALFSRDDGGATIERLTRVATGPAQDGPGLYRQAEAWNRMIAGLGNTGRVREALALYRERRREVPAGVHSRKLALTAGLALEAGCGDLPRAEASEIRDLILDYDRLSNRLRGPMDDFHERSWNHDRRRFRSGSYEELRSRLDASVASCEGGPEAAP